MGYDAAQLQVRVQELEKQLEAADKLRGELKDIADEAVRKDVRHLAYKVDKAIAAYDAAREVMTKDEAKKVIMAAGFDNLGEEPCFERGLSLDYPYLSWDSGDEEACLDGDFTAAQLRAIADFMDSD